MSSEAFAALMLCAEADAGLEEATAVLLRVADAARAADLEGGDTEYDALERALEDAVAFFEQLQAIAEAAKAATQLAEQSAQPEAITR